MEHRVSSEARYLAALLAAASTLVLMPLIGMHTAGAAPGDEHAPCSTPAVARARTITGTAGRMLRQGSTSPVTSPAPAARPRAATAGQAGLVVEGGLPVVGSDRAIRADSDGGETRSTDGLAMEMFSDGSRRVNLQGRFRSYSVVTLGADGSLRLACADHPDAALALARAGAFPPTPTARAPRATVGPPED